MWKLCGIIPVIIPSPTDSRVRRRLTGSFLSGLPDCAMKENKTDLTVMSDYTLYDICIKRPHNDEDFRGIYGIGEFKSQKYAAAFIAAVCDFGGK